MDKYSVIFFAVLIAGLYGPTVFSDYQDRVLAVEAAKAGLQQCADPRAGNHTLWQKECKGN